MRWEKLSPYAVARRTRTVALDVRSFEGRCSDQTTQIPSTPAAIIRQAFRRLSRTQHHAFAITHTIATGTRTHIGHGHALEIGAMTVDVIRILLQEGCESPANIFRLDGRPQLQDHNIPEPRISQYGDLIRHQEKQS